MKLFLLIVLVTLFSCPSYSRSKTELVHDLSSFLGKLNTAFNLDVRLQITTECGLRTEWEKKLVIAMCDDDILFFTKLKNDQKATNSLLTIIGHEYSHILLDWDVTEASNQSLETSILHVSKKIKEIVETDPDLKARLHMYAEANNIPNDSIENIIFSFLLDIDHENKDALGVKLLLWTGGLPEESVLDYFPILIPNSQIATLDYVRSRKKTMHASIVEGLSSWELYRCIAPGVYFLDSLMHLKTWAEKNNLQSTFEAIGKSCTDIDVINNFFERFKSYFPPN